MGAIGASATGYNAAVAGMHKAGQAVASAAEDAMLGTSPESVVGMKVAEAGFTAAARAVRVIDDSLGSLIDALA